MYIICILYVHYNYKYIISTLYVHYTYPVNLYCIYIYVYKPSANMDQPGIQVLVPRHTTTSGSIDPLVPPP